MNPKHEWYYMDDFKCQNFIQDHFSSNFIEMYNSLPYGIMKSDAWRIAVIYIYGGVYADIDTVCLKPIDDWTDDCDLIVSEEPPTKNIANFCFAAIPKHPAILLALEFLLQNYNNPNFLDKLEKTGTPIQNFGQEAFDRAIKTYTQNDNHRIKIFSLDDNAFTPGKNQKSLVWHKTASVMWNNGYESWRKEQQRDFGINF